MSCVKLSADTAAAVPTGDRSFNAFDDMQPRMPLATPVEFGGRAFSAQATDVDYRFYDYRFRYRWSFKPQESVTLRRGAAPQADGLMLVNVMGRFVALHGLHDGLLT